MSESIEFQRYLESIRATYQEWQKFYTPTDAAGKQQRSKEVSPFFDFNLIVKTVKREERERQEEKIERFSILEGLRRYADQQVLLVGRPGSGKSTALARLMLEEATNPQMGIPVLVELRYWQGSIEQLICNSLKRHGLTVERLEAVLSRLLLLFDGVNELPSEEARLQLSAFRRNHPKLPMIFTTRDLSIGGDLGIEKKLEMQPLSEDQMREFVRAYVPEQAEQMLRQLKDRLRELGQTPLLLWMLCSLFQQTGTIPENLGLVFREFTQGYERYLKEDVRIESDKAWWKPVLQQLAWVMMQGEKPTEFRVSIGKEEAVRAIAQFLDQKVPYAEDFARKCLRDLQKHHLIQAEVNQEELEFRHQLIQEYYAAEALLEQLPKLDDEQLKREFLNFLKWTEPVALMLALVNDNQALRIITLAIEVDLVLGAKLAGKVSVHLQNHTVELLSCLDVQFIGNSRRFGESEKQTVRVVDRRTMTQSLTDEYFERRPNMKELVELGLIVNLPQFSDDLKVRLLSVSGSKAAIPKLVEAFEQAIEQENSELSDWINQRLHLLAAGEQFDEVSPFYSEKPYFAYNEVRVWLYQLSESGKDGNESSIRLLIDTLKDKDARYELRNSALEALRRIKNHPQVALAIFEMLDDELCECVTGVHASVLDGIGELGNITMLIPLFEHMFYTLGNLNVCWDGEWDEILKAIASIQSRYKFYNYEIFQAYLKAQKADRQSSRNIDRSHTIINNYPNVTEVKQTIMSNSSKYNFPNAQKVQIFEQVNTYIENNHPTDPEIKTAIADLTLLLTHLQTQHPQVTTESQALTVLDAEFTEIQQSTTHPLITLRQQLLNPERHLQAIKATLAEVAKHYLEESVWSKAAITYFDKLSETPDQGA